MREHPLIAWRREHAREAAELPSTAQAREAYERSLEERSVEGQRALHARAEEARLKRAADTAFWTDQYKLLCEERRKAEEARTVAFEAGDLEAALVAHERASSLASLVEPLREAARHRLGVQMAPHQMGAA
jgi:hypothetical protein